MWVQAGLDRQRLVSQKEEEVALELNSWKSWTGLKIDAIMSKNYFLENNQVHKTVVTIFSQIQLNKSISIKFHSTSSIMAVNAYVVSIPLNPMSQSHTKCWIISVMHQKTRKVHYFSLSSWPKRESASRKSFKGQWNRQGSSEAHNTNHVCFTIPNTIK